MRTIKEALEDGSISLEDEIDYPDMTEEEYKEVIDRLNKRIEQYENPEDMTLMFMWCDEKAKDEIKRLNKENEELKKIQCTFLGTGCKAEIERLNNIINELEKYCFSQLQLYGGGGTAQEYYDKIKELREK